MSFVISSTGKATILKHPQANLDYTVDWTKWLGTDTISSVAFTVDAGLTKGAEAHTDVLAIVWLSGGTTGVTYKVVCVVQTAGGRTEERTFYVAVKDA